MQSNFEGSPVVLITGAGSGLGLALTKAYLKLNHIVIMLDKNHAILDAALLSLESFSDDLVHTRVCDVSSMEQMKETSDYVFKTFGKLDYLYNNAGISGRMAKFWELSAAETNELIDVNLKGVINGLHAFLPHLIIQSVPSHIINISSCFGLVGASNIAAYALTKSAIVSLTESIYFELSETGHPVEISVVCPSFIKTNLLTPSKENSSNELHTLMSQLIERSRPAEDIATHIVKEVEKRTFYILPDREIKDYITGRTDAIINQTKPYRHSLQKLIQHLSKRAQKENRDDK